jgi:anti-sigma regulatory factor (Ser/Thr protein kinase)
LPADPFSRQLIRLAVYLVASRMEFDLAQLEDLRIAVDEASSYVLDYTPNNTTIEVEIGPGKEYLEIILNSSLAKDSDTRSVMPESFSRMIMECVVDDVKINREEGNCRISLVKRCQK